MARKSPKANNSYHKKYYHEKNLRKIQSDRARLNYWRKKFMNKFNCSLQDCKHFAESALREQIEKEMCWI